MVGNVIRFYRGEGECIAAKQCGRLVRPDRRSGVIAV